MVRETTVGQIIWQKLIARPEFQEQPQDLTKVKPFIEVLGGPVATLKMNLVLTSLEEALFIRVLFMTDVYLELHRSGAWTDDLNKSLGSWLKFSKSILTASDREIVIKSLECRLEPSNLKALQEGTITVEKLLLSQPTWLLMG